MTRNSSKIAVALTCLAAVVGVSAVAAAPPGPPPPTPICTLPWWRQSVAHTGQENLFLEWMDFEFGPQWLNWMPDGMIQILWDYFSFETDGVAD